MGDTKDRVGAAGVIVAGGFFKIALYVCVAVLVIWIGKVTYQFGYNIFNQQAMNPGEGQEVTVVIKEDATSYDIAISLSPTGIIASCPTTGSKATDSSRLGYPRMAYPDLCFPASRPVGYVPDAQI